MATAIGPTKPDTFCACTAPVLNELGRDIAKKFDNIIDKTNHVVKSDKTVDQAILWRGVYINSVESKNNEDSIIIIDPRLSSPSPCPDADGLQREVFISAHSGGCVSVNVLKQIPINAPNMLAGRCFGGKFSMNNAWYPCFPSIALKSEDVLLLKETLHVERLAKTVMPKGTSSTNLPPLPRIKEVVNNFDLEATELFKSRYMEVIRNLQEKYEIGAVEEIRNLRLQLREEQDMIQSSLLQLERNARNVFGDQEEVLKISKLFYEQYVQDVLKVTNKPFKTNEEAHLMKLELEKLQKEFERRKELAINANRNQEDLRLKKIIGQSRENEQKLLEQLKLSSKSTSTEEFFKLLLKMLTFIGSEKLTETAAGRKRMLFEHLMRQVQDRLKNN